MLRTTLAAAWSRKRRLAGTTLAVVLGIAFLSATLVLSDSARAGFATAFAEANEGTDALVRSDAALTGGDATVRPSVDAALVGRIAGLDVVAAAAPTVEGTGQVLDPEGDPVGGGGPPTVAAAWIDDPDLTGWDLVQGRAPTGPGQVVVDRATARDADVGPGDVVTVVLPDPVEAEVVGVAAFGDRDSLGGTTYVAFAPDEAQRLLVGGTDRVSGVVVAAADGVEPAELVAALEEVLPPGVEAITGTELTAEQEREIEGDFLGFLTTGLLVFAGVALLVAAFSIFNTFSILSAQRTRESALLRSLGASRAQVLSSTLVESVLVGLVGAALGAAAGAGLAAGMLALMEAAGFGLPTEGVVVSAGTVTAAVVAGIVVTVAGGLVPAWRASRVAPLAALRDAAVDESGGSRWRAALGVVVTGAGVVLLVGAGGALGRAGLAAVLVLVGMVVLGPVVARPVGSLLGAPLALRGTSGDLARRNAVRNPRRTASTAAALLVGVGVVSLFTVFGASVSASISDELDRSFGGDLVVTPSGGFGGAGLAPTTLAAMAERPEVAHVAGLGGGPALLDGEQRWIGFTDPAELGAVADLQAVHGEVATLGDQEVAMAAAFAEEEGLAPGDVVEVTFPDGAVARLTLAVTYDQRALGGEVLVDEELWQAHQARPAYDVALVELADGVSLDEGRAAVEAVTGERGAADVMDRDEFLESQAAAVDALLTVVYVLLAVAIVIALMGIANTISLSVHERTRELGLLRAVGQSRGQLRAMVRWESVIVAAFGSVGGIGLGLFLSWGLVRTLQAAEGFGTYAVPFAALADVAVVGALAGVLAGLRPAWRASRRDVLAAVSAE
ncbi:MAG: ABC transporter permease [Acidimicrobiia bacterium]